MIVKPIPRLFHREGGSGGSIFSIWPTYESVGELRRRPESEPFFSPGKDGEAGDIGFIVDAARRKKGRLKPDRALRQAPIALKQTPATCR